MTRQTILGDPTGCLIVLAVSWSRKMYFHWTVIKISDQGSQCEQDLTVESHHGSKVIMAVLKADNVNTVLWSLAFLLPDTPCFYSNPLIRSQRHIWRVSCSHYNYLFVTGCPNDQKNTAVFADTVDQQSIYCTVYTMQGWNGTKKLAPDYIQIGPL